jgi:hypothetical protein
MTIDLGTILTRISDQLQNLELRLLELETDAAEERHRRARERERERTEANVLLFNGIAVARAAVDAERGERIEADAALQAKIADGDAALNDRVSMESDEKFNAYLDACSRLQSLEKACGFFDGEPAAPAWPPRRAQPVRVVLVPVVPGDDSRPDTYEDGTPV